MAHSRRQFLRRLLAAGAAVPLARFAGGCGSDAREEAPRATTAVPRYFVLVFARGGIDAILTTDPKRPDEVDAKVDLPYGPGDVFEVKGARYGPQLRPLERWLPSLAIINNVQVKTANHPTGEMQFTRMRTGASPRMPTLADVIGWHRDGQPIGAISVGRRILDSTSSGELDCTRTRVGTHDLCDHLETFTRDQVERAAAGLETMAIRSASSPETSRHARDTAAFMRQFAVAPPFRVAPWVTDRRPDMSSAGLFGATPSVPARDFQRALWLLEHGLTKCITLGLFDIEWDSHTNNLRWQTEASQVFFPLLAKFFDELHVRRNRYGTLAEQTVVVCGSELGRFPVLNHHHGKDHWPEAPYLFFGPNIRTNGARGPVYGASNRRMEAEPIDVTTGYPAANGYRPTFDDIGTTLLAGFGIEPTTFGYQGRRLPFLVRGSA